MQRIYDDGDKLYQVPGKSNNVRRNTNTEQNKSKRLNLPFQSFKFVMRHSRYCSRGSSQPLKNIPGSTRSGSMSTPALPQGAGRYSDSWEPERQEGTGGAVASVTSSTCGVWRLACRVRRTVWGSSAFVTVTPIPYKKIMAHISSKPFARDFYLCFLGQVLVCLFLGCCCCWSCCSAWLGLCRRAPTSPALAPFPSCQRGFLRVLVYDCVRFFGRAGYHRALEAREEIDRHCSSSSSRRTRAGRGGAINREAKNKEEK